MYKYWQIKLIFALYTVQSQSYTENFFLCSGKRNKWERWNENKIRYRSMPTFRQIKTISSKFDSESFSYTNNLFILRTYAPSSQFAERELTPQKNTAALCLNLFTLQNKILHFNYQNIPISECFFSKVLQSWTATIAGTYSFFFMLIKRGINIVDASLSSDKKYK